MVQNKLPLINSAHGPETRNIINELIKLFNGMGYTYDEALQKAHDVLNEAKQTNDMNKDVQEQINRLIISDGESDAEVIQARGDAPLLKDRLDKTDTQLAETSTKTQNVMNTQLQQRSLRRPLLTFVDDDGTDDVYQKIKPLTDELQFKMTCAIVSNFVNKDSYMTESQLKELYKTGLYEFVSHTANHPPLAELATEEEQLSEMIECRDWLQDRGYTGNIIVYPFGSTNATVRKNAQKVYRAGVNIDNSFHLINYPTPLKTYDLQRVYIDYGVDVAKQKIDEAIANNGWLIIGMHCFYETWTQADLREIVNYARSVGIDIVNLSEGMDSFGNILEIGDSVRLENQGTQFINADGETFGNDLSKVIHRVNTVDGWNVTNDTPAPYFPLDKTTVTIFLGSTSAGFPVNGIATLITESYSIQETRYWTTQEFRPSGGTDSYRRYWIYSTEKWSDWKEVGDNYYYKKYNSITGTTPITEFNDNAVTVTAVGATTGFPENSAGTIVTYSLGNGFSYQEFKKHNADVTYKRTCKTDGTWDSWTKDLKGTWGYKSFNHGSIPANSAVEKKQIITGMGLNDTVVVTPHETFPQGLIYSAYISAVDEIAIRVFNATASPVTCSMNWRYNVIKFNF